MASEYDEMKKGDGLLVVDVQKDFCPGGALAVEGGDQVVPVLNEWIAAAEQKRVALFASRDWHPKRHVSFEDEGGQWPVHCVQDTDGAAFHPDLELPEDAVVVTKGTRFDQDQNSVFDGTGFEDFLKREKIGRLWVGGLAQDVCVLATVLDSREAGFEVFVIRDATKPVTPEGGKEAIEKMEAAGATLV